MTIKINELRDNPGARQGRVRVAPLGRADKFQRPGHQDRAQPGGRLGVAHELDVLAAGLEQRDRHDR